MKRKCVLITRPAGQAKEIIAKLRRSGAKVIHIPMIEIADPSDNFRSLDRAISQLDKYDWLIFTSQNAVERFFARLSLRGAKATKQSNRHPVDCFAPLAMTAKFAAVGPATAAAIGKYGVRKVIVPRKNNYSANGLVEVLKHHRFKGKRVLFPCAKKAKEILPAWLKKQGAKLDKVEAYQTVMPKNIDRPRLKKLVSENKIDVILFYSDSAEKNFIKIVGRQLAKKYRPSD